MKCPTCNFEQTDEAIAAGKCPQCDASNEQFKDADFDSPRPILLKSGSPRRFFSTDFNPLSLIIVFLVIVISILIAGQMWRFVFVFWILYIIPSIVALLRKHPQALAILILNMFWGWTIVGWIVAFLWASMDMRR